LIQTKKLDEPGNFQIACILTVSGVPAGCAHYQYCLFWFFCRSHRNSQRRAWIQVWAAELQMMGWLLLFSSETAVPLAQPWYYKKRNNLVFLAFDLSLNPKHPIVKYTFNRISQQNYAM
jgi:hypothetical protein